MPGDETYIHLIDTLGGNGPMWLFVAGILALFSFVIVKMLPSVRLYVEGRQAISEKQEERKSEELRLRDARDREYAANSALMAEAMNRQAESGEAMAEALTILTTRIDASQERSSRMSDQIDSVHEKVGIINRKVNEIHSVAVVNR